MKPAASLTMAIHATSRGFGYVLFEGPFVVHDWGTVAVKSDKNAACLRKLEAMLDRFMPEALVLELAGKGSSLHSERIGRLYVAAAGMAASKGVSVHVYPFSEVQACFRSVRAHTRQEIAEAVSRSVDALSELVPKPRRAWDGEHRRMAIFCAAALVLTHFQAGTMRLFEDLKRRPKTEGENPAG